MNITALSETYVPNTSPLTSGKATAADPNTTFLQAGDASAVERIFGESSLAQAEANPDSLTTLQWLNRTRENGYTANVGDYLPEAELTTSDTALIEKVTGTTSLEAAGSTTSGNDLILNIAFSRENGSLTGNVSTAFLGNILTAAKFSEGIGGITGLPSSSFLEQAIAYVQNEAASSTLDTNA